MGMTGDDLAFRARFLEQITRIDTVTDEDPQRAISDTRALVAPLSGSFVPELIINELLTSASAVTINAASRICDVAALDEAQAWLGRVIAAEQVQAQVLQHALFNMANLLSARTHCDLQLGGAGVIQLWDHFGALSTARQLWRTVAADELAEDDLRSRAACNLANTLDDSGRWVEAYEFYDEALFLDPLNGNAAGNAALLLDRLLARGWEHSGHLAALRDHYLSRAKELREHTVGIAGEAAAARYDAMEAIEAEGAHTLHSGDSEDPYQQWIVVHRLALTPSVEGLGAHFSRWDSASLSRATFGPEGRDGTPFIFAMLDALKAEFIVARRLAFEGELDLVVFGGLPSPDDTGAYALMGEGVMAGAHYAKLVLAQRAALDVLDKLAVSVNHHLQLGDRPDRIKFRSFWKTTKGTLRDGLIPSGGDPRVLLALAELAEDLQEDCFYHRAQLLRNAGTHRIVLPVLGVVPGSSARESVTKVQADDLAVATIQALQVARAAYMYVKALLEAWVPEEGEFLPIFDMPNSTDHHHISLSAVEDNSEEYNA